MNEYTMVLAVKFPPRWPPPREVPITAQPVGQSGLVAALSVTPDGRIRFTAGDRCAAQHNTPTSKRI
jgi:hypothetical protein